MFFILFSCFGNGGFNSLSRGHSPSKKNSKNSNDFQCDFISSIVITVL